MWQLIIRRLQQIPALFSQTLDPVGQTFPDGSTTQLLTDVNDLLMADVVAITIDL